MGKYALFSLYEQGKAALYARKLVEAGFRIIATEPTLSELGSAGVPAISVADYTKYDTDHGFPPTLHPKIEHALTGSKGGDRIELVYDRTYPLDVGNDVGGHTLLALAVKGDRIPVCSGDDMERVIKQVASEGRVSRELREELQVKALTKIVDHYSKVLESRDPDVGFIGMRRHLQLGCGENQYQTPAHLYRSLDYDGPDSLPGFRLLSGQTPCYTNLADLDSLLDAIARVAGALHGHYGKVPHVAVAGKHGNPVGLAVDWESPLKAVDDALWGRPMAIWGGEFVCNFVIDVEVAGALTASEGRDKMLGGDKWMLDVIAAPKASDDAVKALSARERTKLLVSDALVHPDQLKHQQKVRHVRGGYLVCPPADYVLDMRLLDWCKGKPKKEWIDSLLVAWASAYSSFMGGNEVALARDGRLVGVGGGPSTVEAAENAVRSARDAGHDTSGCVFAADAFFPFTDAPKLLCEAGCVGGVVPAGGTRFDEVRAYFSEKGAVVGFIPEQYRGFARH